MNTLHTILPNMAVLWMLGMALFVRVANFRQAARLKQQAEADGVIVRLYWQQPLASIQANRCLYACLVIPSLMMFAASFIGLATRDWGFISFNAFFWAAVVCLCDQIRGPTFFYISNQGIYWSQAVSNLYIFGGTFYPWDKIIRHRWRSIAGEDFYCFTPERSDDQLRLETQLGPFTAEQRAKIDEVLEFRVEELATATEKAE